MQVEKWSPRRREICLVFTLVAVQFVHILDFVVMMPLGPVLMEDLSITSAQFGLLVSSYNFTAGIFGLLFGLIIDRFDRKRLIIMVLLAFTIGTILCGFAKTYGQLLVFRIFTGVWGGFLKSLVYAMVTDVVPLQRRGKAMGIIMSSFSICSVLGVPLGLAIADSIGWKAMFICIGMLSLLVWLLCFWLLPKGSNMLQTGGNTLKVLQQYSTTVKNKDYRIAYFMVAVLSFSMFLLIPYLAPFAVSNMGVAVTDIKYMYFTGGAFTVVTARIFGVWTDDYGARKMFFILAVLSALPITLYTTSGAASFWRYIFLGTLFMTIIAGRMVPFMTMVSAVPSMNERGAFMSIFNAIRSLSTALAAYLAGLFLVQNEETEVFLNFHHLGFIAVGLTAMILVVAYMSPIGTAKGQKTVV